MLNKSLLFAGLLMASIAVAQARADSPEILKIRENYAAVNAKIEAGDFTFESKREPYCAGAITERERWTDSRGTVRRYRERGGSDDSAATVTSWFDQAGRLDFVLVQYGNVHGGDAELRVYYNDRGEVIRSLKSGNPSYMDLWRLVDAEPYGRFEEYSGCR